MQSLILPGWGQYYAESKTMFKVFALTEVMLLASYTGFKVWSNWKEDDFRTFAVTHADVKLEGKPGRYFVDIGNFDNIFDFNQFQLQNRNVAALYPETEEFAWQWDSKANRDRFEDMRISRDRADDRARFTLAAIFVNHVVSAIHSTLAVYKLNKRLARKGLGLHFDIDSYSRNRHVALALVKKF